MRARLPRVLVCDPLHEEGLKLLKESGFTVDYAPRITYKELLERVSAYECLIVRSRTKVTGEVLGRALRLKLVARAGSGVDNIDLAEASRRGVEVLRVPEAVADSVAELTIALILTLARGLNHLLNSRETSSELGLELREKTLGVVGAGSVGRRVAKIARSLRMKVLLNDVVRVPEDFLKEVEAEEAPLQALLESSDFLTLHVPLDEDTLGMIGERELRSMKPTAYLINTSRPEVVEAEALYRALRGGWIAGAAFDADIRWVKRNERLASLPNFLYTPHIGAHTREAFRRMSLEVARKVAETLTLKPSLTP